MNIEKEKHTCMADAKRMAKVQAADKSTLVSQKAMAIECICKAADMPFGRCCKTTTAHGITAPSQEGA